MPMIDNTMTDKRIYVACLSSYNNGHLHGAWIDVTPDKEVLQEEINAMLKASPMPDAEEWAIHDHEGLGELGEYASLDTIIERAEYLDAAEEAGIPEDVAVKLLDYHGGDVEYAKSQMEEDYSGAWDTLEDYVAELYEDLGYLSAAGAERLVCYIDWERVARDLFHNLTTIEGNDGLTHVFWCR